MAKDDYTFPRIVVLPEVPVAVQPSRLYCREAGKAPIFTPVQESSGESRIKRSRRREQEATLALIPKPLHEHINSAFPANVCLVATVLPNGFAQVSPRGSTMVYDDEHLALWERGKGSVNASLTDGTKVTIFLRKIALRESGLLPKGGIARFYGTAKIHNSGPVYEEIWKRLIQPEKDRDPQKNGFGVLVKVEHAEDLDGKPLDIK
jgi:hypothetical protein